MSAQIPALVRAAQERATAHGFALSCEPEVGQLLAVLAAAVPEGGHIGELGTGAGVGTAWLVHGLGTRMDAEVVTIEVDPAVSALAAMGDYPGFVRFVVGDALERMEEFAPYDLIFADAPAGKWWGLDRVVAALRPGGMLVVDDMWPAHDPKAQFHAEQKSAREAILECAELHSAELDFATTVIVSVRRVD